MGGQDIATGHDPAAFRTFTRALLRDLHALEQMIERGMIERGQRRFGAEQELFLVNRGWRPAPLAMEVLERVPEPPYTTELARYNLEFNLNPITLGGTCFSDLEADLNRLLTDVRTAAQAVGAEVVLTGILPTLTKSDLSLDNITPKRRYHQLNEAMNRMRGGAYRLRIVGTDELNIEHDSVMLESCNTSCQIHLQVDAEDFARMYNVAQAMIGPVLSACVNSPLLFGRRLWSETRIALFQQSLDTRSTSVHMRELSPRVRFGERWVRESAIELFQDDISKFRALIASEIPEDPIATLESGGIPALKALQLHNGTVYRWNRPCYGVGDGKPHLRIECRAIPAGPSVIDEVANAVFWTGLVYGAMEEWGDVSQRMSFDDAKRNFLAASRLGLNAGFQWMDDEAVAAPTLLIEQLLPVAEAGLQELGVDSGDAERYLGVLRTRVESKRTGASWMVDSLEAMAEEGTHAERLAAIAGAIHARQTSGRPVVEWELAQLEESGSWRPNFETVEQYMSTTLFTVHEDELLDMVAFLMDRQLIRHVLVEDDAHALVGIVSYRSLIRMVAQGKDPKFDPIPVKSIMHRDPVTVTPQTKTVEAIDLMRERRVSCLPVVSGGKLVGIVTTSDFMPIAYQLLLERLREE